MSPASVSNFVGDLVAMATAFERLPQVEADLADARNQINAHLNTIQRLEAKLMERNNDIAVHLQHIRSLEVERDDAQFHALEADDRTQRALEFIKTIFGNAGSLIQALEPPAPPKPEPSTPDVPVSAVPAAAAEVKADYEDIQHRPETMPINQPEPGFQHFTAPLDGPDSPVSYGASPAPEVAAQPGEPSANSSSQPSPAPDASSSIVEGATSASPQLAAEPPPAPDASRPYAGLSYSEAHAKYGLAFKWPGKDQWLDGGGSLDMFYA